MQKILVRKRGYCALFRSADLPFAFWQRRTVVSQSAIGQKKSGNLAPRARQPMANQTSRDSCKKSGGLQTGCWNWKLIGVKRITRAASPTMLQSVKQVGAAMDVCYRSARRRAFNKYKRPLASQNVIGEIRDGLAAQLAARCRETSAADRLWDFGYETRQ